MKKYKVESSNIDLVSYDNGTKELQITFKNGNTYSYPGMSASTVCGLLFADSIGKKFHDSIKICKAMKI
jgi:hypothetical protein